MSRILYITNLALQLHVSFDDGPNCHINIMQLLD